MGIIAILAAFIAIALAVDAGLFARISSRWGPSKRRIAVVPPAAPPIPTPPATPSDSESPPSPARPPPSVALARPASRTARLLTFSATAKAAEILKADPDTDAEEENEPPAS